MGNQKFGEEKKRLVLQDVRKGHEQALDKKNTHKKTPNGMNTQLVTKMLNDGVKINFSVSHMLNIHRIVCAAVS